MCSFTQWRTALGRRGSVTFVLAKVTKTVSAEMLLSAAGLCPQTGKNLGLQLFFGGCFFSMALKIASQFRRLNLVASIPCMRKVFGSCLFFIGPQEALRGLLCPGPIHRLAGFPRFFPKLFCGREGYFHDTVIAETKPSLSGCSAWWSIWRIIWPQSRAE